MYEFWYDYVKPKYDEKTKLCYMDTNMVTVSLYTYKHDIKTLQKMLKLDVILQIRN